MECPPLGPVYTIPFSFHIGLVSYRIGLLFTRYRFHSISDWPPVYTGTHQSDMLHTVFAFSNENFTSFHFKLFIQGKKHSVHTGKKLLYNVPC